MVQWMYSAIVRSVIIYGVVAWSKRTNLGIVKANLFKVLSLACVCLLIGAATTTAIEMVINLTPLHMLVESIAKKTRRTIGEELIRHTSQSPEGDTN